MASSNSPPDNLHNNPNNDQCPTSSVDDDSHSQNATFPRQNNPKPDRNLSMYRSDSSSTIKTNTPPHDITDDSIPIEPELYMYLVSGNKDRVLETSENLCKFKCIDEKNSVLHVLACAGQDMLIMDIIPLCKDIIYRKNLNGDLAFHCAAKSVQFNALKALMDWKTYAGEAGVSRDLLKEKNEVGDTALHIALENNEEQMALCLVNECPESCYVMNEKQVCPLYVAIELGYWDLVEKMMECVDQSKADLEDALMKGKSVVHAAIKARNITFLEQILNNHGKLINSLDEEHHTPLSYAAFIGYLDGVQYLFKKFPQLAYKRNKDINGSFPIHKAASGGHVKIIKELYSTKQLLNKKGQNILHVATRDGKEKVVSYLLKRLELDRFINLKDVDGNTPLHLATRNFNPRVVYILTRDPRTKHQLQNKDGLTALDLAEVHTEPLSAFEVQLTWMALRYVDAPRSPQSTRQTYFQEKFAEETSKNDSIGLESLNDRTNTFLLVATLVATVTFAAGFTAPGGYNQDGPNIGMAVLTDKWAFQVFIICNTSALFSSIMSVVSLIWAYNGDLKVIRVSLKIALPLLGFALTMMSLAFMTGLFVVLETKRWLSYVVVGMGFVFLLVLFVLYTPLYSPSYIKNPVVRFLFTGPFLWLLFLYEMSKMKH